MRGKLGIDNMFLGFAFLGAIIIPTYFHFRDKRKKAAIRKIREMKVAQLGELDMDELSPDFTAIDVDEYNRV